MGFQVVTSAEVHAGVVHLDRFRAVLPLTGSADPALTAYARGGGHLLTSPTQLLQYGTPYVSLQPSTPAVEVVPVVDGRSAWLLVAGIGPSQSWNGTLTIELAGLGLPPGNYRLIDLATGRHIATVNGGSRLAVQLAVAPGTFEVWHLVG